MANHKSALKRIRQTAKRTARNKAVRTRVKSVTKSVREAVTKKQQLDQVEALLIHAVKTIDKAASKGVIPKQRASRKISRLNKLVNGYRSVSEAA